MKISLALHVAVFTQFSQFWRYPCFLPLVHSTVCACAGYAYYLQVETLEKTNESFTVKLEMEKMAKRDARQTIDDLNNEISRVSKELKKTQNGNFLV